MKSLRAVVGMLLALAAAGADGAVETVTWTGGTGTWFNAANWLPVVAPKNGGGTNYWAEIDGGANGTISSVDLASDTTVDRLGVDDGDELNLSPSATLTLLESARVDGVLTFEEATHTTSDSRLEIGGNVALDGVGAIVLTEFNDSVVTSLSTTNRLTNSCCIEGEGRVGNNLLWITNEGTIDATTGTLRVDPSPGALGVDNTGTLSATGPSAVLELAVGEYRNASGLVEATGGGRVIIETTVVLDNDGGVIRAGDASEIVFEGPEISGGLIEGVGSGSARTVSGTTSFADIELDLPVEIESGTFLQISGTCTNQGGIVLENDQFSSSDSVLLIDGEVSLSPGLVSLTEQSDNILRGTTAEAVLTNGGVIAGEGRLGVNQLRLVNHGTIRADVASRELEVDPSEGAAGVRNPGEMVAMNGGTLELGPGEFENLGGEIRAESGSTVDLNCDRIAGGTLRAAATGSIRATGAQTILEDVELADGTVAIGPSETLYLRGTIDADGEFLLEESLVSSSDGTLEMDGDVLLIGNGGIRMTETYDSFVRGRTGSEKLTNRATIAGAGRLGANAMLLANEGLVAAAGGTLTVDPSDPGGGTAGVVNTGIMTAEGTGIRMEWNAGGYENTGECRASDSAVFALQSGAAVANTGGILHAVAGGRIETTGASIVGGSVTGVVDAVSGATLLQDVALDGTVGIRAAADVVLAGGIDNSATLFLEENTFTTSDAYLTIRNAATVSGVGEIELRESYDCIVRGESGSDLLTNQSTIRGRGRLGSNSLFVDNQGVIRAEGGFLDLDPASPGDGSAGFRNGGSLRAEGPGAELRLQPGKYDNEGGVIEAGTGGTVRFGYQSSMVNTNGTVRALDAGEVILDQTVIAGGAIESQGSGLVRTISGTTDLEDVDLDGLVRVDAYSTLRVRDRVRNDGVILLEENGVTTSDSRIQVDGEVELQGTGAVRMTEPYDSVISGGGPSDRLVSDNLVEGRGRLGANAMMFTNRGVVDANVAGGVLEIDPADGVEGVVNEGTIRASNGGILKMNSGTWVNDLGVVRAVEASFVDLVCETLSGGTLDTTGTGRIRTSSAAIATLKDVTLTGALDVTVHHTLQLRDTITNHGTIELLESATTTSDARLQIVGPTVLEGAGVVRMTERQDSVFRSDTSGLLLTNRSTIEGEGKLGDNVMALANEGTLRATGAGSLYVDLPGAGLDNHGSIEAEGSGGFEFREPLSNAGTVEIDAGSRILVQGDYEQSAGSTRVDGELDPTGTVRIEAGVLGGTGVVRADVDNLGATAPGASTGSLAIEGNYSQDPVGRLDIEIGGTGAGEFDRLTATGVASLDGTLSVSMIGGFDPAIGHRFEILSFAELDGSFSDELLPALGGGARKFVVEYSETNVVLSVASAFTQTYNQWKADHYTPAEQADPLISGPDADPDGDTILNAFEYGFGFDPDNAELVPITAGQVADGGSVFVTISFPASTSAAAAVFGVRSSDGVSPWLVETTEEIERVPTAHGFDELTWKVLAPIDSLAWRYYQLSLELN